MSFQMNLSEAGGAPLYRFGRLGLEFRGPEPDLTAPYIACVGGSETFGKFTELPFPDLLGGLIGRSVVNFGAAGAGPCAFLEDDAVLDALSQAELCIVQVTGAATISNRFFSVRPRRNERIMHVTDELRRLYPGVKLDGIRFTGRLLARLHQLDAAAFVEVEEELKLAWVDRMRRFLGAIETRKMLFWFADRAPEASGDGLAPDCRPAPAFVDARMIGALAGLVEQTVICTVPPESGTVLRLDQPILGPEQAARRCAPSPRMHMLGAERLAQFLRPQRGAAA